MHAWKQQVLALHGMLQLRSCVHVLHPGLLGGLVVVGQRRDAFSDQADDDCICWLAHADTHCTAVT